MLLQGRETPQPLKPRSARPQEPTHNYENHSLSAPAHNGEQITSTNQLYMNINLGSLPSASPAQKLVAKDNAGEL